MNKIERIKMIKAMELIARNINDEYVFEAWLMDGVADGDIDYGDLEVSCEDEDYFDCYIDDESFSDIMSSFLYCMKRAAKSGGLYCDKICSAEL